MLAAADGVDSADTDFEDSADDAGRRLGRMRVRGDGAALPFRPAFDGVFSNAALHWMTDHEAVFQSVHGALVPGGRFVAQCGGEGNLRLLLDRAHALMRSPRFAEHFRGWRDPWEFAGESATRARLARAGFEDVDVWLEPAPTMFEGPETFAEFVSCVCVRDHLDRLRPDERGAFVAALTAQAGADDPPFTLDYRRLNIVARKPAVR
jgi:trans-aconitate 2-methyltransferase